MPGKPLLKRFLDLSLRTKFFLSFLAVIGFGGILTLTIGTRIEHTTILNLAQRKVRHDLDTAWVVYNEKLQDIRDIIRFNANRESVIEALQEKNLDRLSQYLRRARKEFILDALTLTDSRGRVLARTGDGSLTGDDQGENPLVLRALRGETVAATQIIPRADLEKENPELPQRAFIRIVPTPKASPREREYEEDGMMMKAAAPVFGENRELLGVIYGGILLNLNHEIVDKVKEVVYKDEKYKGEDIGTATIFQGDLRISTNVKTEQGGRAIGTRVSQEVHQAVLREGRPWIHRAFVVNSWYLSAYEPIKNIDGNIIGILYVGILEKPYIDLRNRVMLTFTGLASLCAVLLLAILYFITSSITHPLKKMVEATTILAQGDLNHKIDLDNEDELGQLAHSFNRMTNDLNKANQKLIQWGKTLEKRVEERTGELKDAQKSLIQSAKLASLGKMAAGVAHEINNPLTSILINAHLMLEKSPHEHEYYESLKLVTEETARCSEIVKGLLEFSRQNPPRKTLSDINLLFENALSLLENQASFHNISIEKHLSPDLPDILADGSQIKQVLWNLLINAAEAMPSGGNLTLTTRLTSDRNHIELIMKDTGVGISKMDLPNLFDPFFTTKSSGTGLGLSVSYGIIEQHDGQIFVESEPGRGSKFTIRLPIEK